MIVSDQYQYVFVEQPLTASTAIAAELTELYGGYTVLSKHSNYAEFLEVATEEQKAYRVIVGVRNPLDQIVSGYQKLVTNHLNSYDDPSQFVENGGWISKHRRKMFRFATDESNDFAAYLKKFFGRPRVKTSQYLWCPRQYDFIIRFEQIQEDFAALLKLVGAEQVRDLPVKNKTKGKRDFSTYYSADTVATVRYVFAPIMQAWGYELPIDWSVRSASPIAMAQFRIVNSLARFVVFRLGLNTGHYRRLRARLTR